MPKKQYLHVKDLRTKQKTSILENVFTCKVRRQNLICFARGRQTSDMVFWCPAVSPGPLDEFLSVIEEGSLIGIDDMNLPAYADALKMLKEQYEALVESRMKMAESLLEEEKPGVSTSRADSGVATSKTDASATTVNSGADLGAAATSKTDSGGDDPLQNKTVPGDVATPATSDEKIAASGDEKTPDSGAATSTTDAGATTVNSGADAATTSKTDSDS